MLTSPRPYYNGSAADRGEALVFRLSQVCLPTDERARSFPGRFHRTLQQSAPSICNSCRFTLDTPLCRSHSPVHSTGTVTTNPSDGMKLRTGVLVIIVRLCVDGSYAWDCGTSGHNTQACQRGELMFPERLQIATCSG